MKTSHGFTLVEFVMFIIITALVANTIILAMNVANIKTPTVHQQIIATQLAKRCMEGFIKQRRLLGYSNFSCPSTTVPAYCTSLTGYTVSVNVACTTLNGDANYKTITVTISGLGSATLSTMVSNTV